jgi:hypothetical protein
MGEGKEEAGKGCVGRGSRWDAGSSRMRHIQGVATHGSITSISSSTGHTHRHLPSPLSPHLTLTPHTSPTHLQAPASECPTPKHC